MLNAMMLTIGVTLLATVASFFAGMAFRAWQVRRREAAQLRVPVPWPLEARPLVNTGEEQVWDWLRHTFYDHLIMVKVPVLRFTIPLNRERYRSAKWLDMLGEVYTTFTVCTTEGVVIGCVDVPGKRGMSQANQDLKDALLSDCNISYTVLRPTRLPQPEAMRMAFLGDWDPKKFLEYQRKNPRLQPDEFDFLKANVRLCRELGMTSDREGKAPETRRLRFKRNTAPRDMPAGRKNASSGAGLGWGTRIRT